MRVAIVSDSHVPSRERSVPEPVLERVRAADHAVHAGDLDSPEALETFETAAADLTAVRGNIDPPGLSLPQVATVELGELRLVVTHGTGPLEGYRERVAGVVDDHADGPTVGVAGHTHEPMDAVVDGYRLLNPGSCTGADPAARTTCMTAELAGDGLSVTLHEE
jgi:putative phosphoesterase